MKYSVMTDKGIKRATNQDSCFVECLSARSCFAVVCDGMGGGNAGNVASDIAVKTISRRVNLAWRTDMSIDSAQNILTTAIAAANICVYDEAQTSAELKGMGTTVVCAVILNDRVVIAHAGDSRAYIAGKELKRVTKDHSLVQSMVDEGKLTVTQAQHHPDKNYITRALGVEEHLETDFIQCDFNIGDKLLLCSDGLTNFVSETEILRIMTNFPTEEIAQQLIDKANENGGGDNITAVIIEN